MPEPAGASKSYTPVEVQGLARTKDFIQVGGSYSFEQATRPSTIGFVLASSPIALLAWFVSVSSAFFISDIAGLEKSFSTGLMLILRSRLSSNQFRFIG